MAINTMNKLQFLSFIFAVLLSITINSGYLEVIFQYQNRGSPSSWIWSNKKLAKMGVSGQLFQNMLDQPFSFDRHVGRNY